jgi:hypothetical protein
MEEQPITVTLLNEILTVSVENNAVSVSVIEERLTVSVLNQVVEVMVGLPTQVYVFDNTGKKAVRVEAQTNGATITHNLHNNLVAGRFLDDAGSVDARVGLKRLNDNQHTLITLPISDTAYETVSGYALFESFEL